MYKISKVLGFPSMEKIIRKRDGFVADALFYFEPVQRFKYTGDMFSFRGSSYSASKGVLQ